MAVSRFARAFFTAVWRASFSRCFPSAMALWAFMRCSASMRSRSKLCCARTMSMKALGAGAGAWCGIVADGWWRGRAGLCGGEGERVGG